MESMEGVFFTRARAVNRTALFFFCLFLSLFPVAARGEDKAYVGREVCKGCHEKVYANFIAYSKMSGSFHSLELRKKGLTAEELKQCYGCHTTGYGKPGGFKSEAETPALKDLGCESCHGPGSVHAASSNPKDIQRHLEAKDCEVCHDKNRVAAFNYKPILFGGAH